VPVLVGIIVLAVAADVSYGGARPPQTGAGSRYDIGDEAHGASPWIPRPREMLGHAMVAGGSCPACGGLCWRVEVMKGGGDAGLSGADALHGKKGAAFTASLTVRSSCSLRCSCFSPRRGRAG
jgi:hypothetical protein